MLEIAIRTTEDVGGIDETREDVTGGGVGTVL